MRENAAPALVLSRRQMSFYKNRFLQHSAWHCSLSKLISRRDKASTGAVFALTSFRDVVALQLDWFELNFPRYRKVPAIPSLEKSYISQAVLDGNCNFLFLGKSLSIFDALCEPVQIFSSRKIPLNRSPKVPHPVASIIFAMWHNLRKIASFWGFEIVDKLEHIEVHYTARYGLVWGVKSKLMMWQTNIQNKLNLSTLWRWTRTTILSPFRQFAAESRFFSLFTDEVGLITPDLSGGPRNGKFSALESFWIPVVFS